MSEILNVPSRQHRRQALRRRYAFLRLQARRVAFRIRLKPVGEVMYFGVDYYPEQWVFPYGGTADNPEGAWERDAELMAKAGINVVRIGEFSWGLCEPEEGKYDFLWLRRVMDIMAASRHQGRPGHAHRRPAHLAGQKTSRKSCRSTSTAWSNTKARAAPSASTTMSSGTLPSAWSKTWPRRWATIRN